MKYLFLIFLCFVLLQFKYEQIEDDKIIWQENVKLSWEDFQGVPDSTIFAHTKTPASAASAIGIRIVPIEHAGHYTCSIEAVFFKKSSFYFEKSDTLLNHEQLHFDIAELIARKWRMKLDNCICPNDSVINSIVSEARNKKKY